MKRYIPLAFGLGLILAGPGIDLAHGQQTVVSIQQERFLLNGVVTHQGTVAEGLLLNSRMIQAIFDDENPQTVGKSAYPDTGVWDAERNVTEFIAALPGYAAKGLRLVVVGMQGGAPKWTSGNGQPNITTAFHSDGTPKGAWLNRLDRVVRAADQHGIVVMVSFFYFGQDHRLANEAAVLHATDRMTDWLLPYTNVLVEINNEANGWYEHAILQPSRVHELITRVKQRSGGRLKVSTSVGHGGALPPATVVSAADYVLLHGNGQTAEKVAWMVDQVRAMSAYKASPKPIVFNEDSTTIANLDAAVSKRASWGYFDWGENNYRDGYQAPPVNWTINTSAKRAFFDRIAALTATAGSAPSHSTMRVVSFTLINSDTNQPISGFETLEGGEITLNLAQLPTRNLNLRANTTPSTVGSVLFGLNGQSKYRIENAAPYALAGDDYGKYHAWTPGPGTYVVNATPYSGSNAGGSAGSALSVGLIIVDGTSGPTAPDTTAPVVTLTYDVQTGQGEVKATDESGIALVEVLLDGVRFAAGDRVPFAYSTGVLSPGTYTLTGRVSDPAGNVGTATTSFTIPPPPTSSDDPRVTHFTLINADTNQPVSGFEVVTGGEILLTLSQLPTRNLNLRATTSPSTVGSVRFGVNATSSYSTENAAPYALAGDTNGNYAPWNLELGSHVVTATPYTQSNAGGTAGSALVLTIKIEEVSSGGSSGGSSGPAYRVNAGGSVVSSTPDWSADVKAAPSPYVNAGAAGNATYGNGAVINLGHPSVPAGTPASLFQTERYDPPAGVDMQWSFPVTPGTYEVRLYFAEIYFTAPGMRVFDVLIESKAVLSHYDIVADVGAFNGVMKSFIVTSDANLDIRLGRIRENPKISAIEIVAR